MFETNSSGNDLTSTHGGCATVPTTSETAQVPDPEKARADMKDAVERVRALIAKLKDIEDKEREIAIPSYKH